MGVEPLIALPPRVLVAGRLQCGAARAGVRREHGECAELAHQARGSSKLFTARHAENVSREVGENKILAQCAKATLTHAARFGRPQATGEGQPYASNCVHNNSRGHQRKKVTPTVGTDKCSAGSTTCAIAR